MPENSDIERLLTTPVPVFSVQEAEVLASELFGLDGKAKPLGSERDKNFHLVTDSGDQYVIKIANSAEDPAIIDMQLKALKHIEVVDPALPVPKVVLSKAGRMIEEVVSVDGRKHPVRVMTFLRGTVSDDEVCGGDLYRQMGKYLARTAKALRGFFHPIANYEILWDIKHAANLRSHLSYVGDPVLHEQAKYFLDRFEKNVLPRIPQLRAQIVHNDFAPYNILVDETNHDNIVGIIDFGDLTHTSLIIDLATTIAASLREEGDPVNVAVQIVAGYNEITPLEDTELSVLFDLVGTRLMMLNVIASWRVTLHPENRDYIIGGVESTWKALKLWMDQDPEKVTRRFFRTCGLWEQKGSEIRNSESIPALMSRRESLLGPFAYLFYEQPLHIVKGEGVWLFDRDNNRYLDAYNNVPQVGHSHPHVVNKIAEQARLLNTSTRYLHEHVLSLAERITAKLPEPLSVCTFVCTGSEANELAWIMAKLVSGNEGALITNYSYHGSTYATGQFSTENLPNGSLATHVRTFGAPTSNLAWSKENTRIQSAISSLVDDGLKPAMCIVDTSFVSDGIFTSPDGYLQYLANETRAAGGLFVADEVQGGFGRFGKRFWGFEFDDVIPDIVTMGKPMGNGHPIAAVVTRPEIAEAVARDRGYFNTFGGNPVSCAAGLAVLDVIEQEGLQENAFKVGEYLIQGLEELQKAYPMLGRIHGSGLLLGADIITENNAPDGNRANQIMNHMRQNGVLIGITGKDKNVLKIRPPLVFEGTHAGILLEALSKALEVE
jgi:4-aminobutyrate aminotransferase-like enzyme/Ser/Thr protein kinase RdoA (MazF antagonist)